MNTVIVKQKSVASWIYLTSKNKNASLYKWNLKTCTQIVICSQNRSLPSEPESITYPDISNEHGNIQPEQINRNVNAFLISFLAVRIEDADDAAKVCTIHFAK